MQAPPGRLRWAVHVGAWAPAPAEWDLLLSLLPGEEGPAVLKFRQEADRKRALVSRLLQRAAAAAALGLPHGDVAIARTKGRKPYAANLEGRGDAPNFNFNVSHEGDYVILAAEPLAICGCDVAAPQQLRRPDGQPLAEMLGCFKQQFTDREWQSIQAAGPAEAEVEAQFRKLWSLKEAFVKATGEGLGFDLKNAEFSIQGAVAAVAVRGVPQPRWRLHLHQLGGDHWASVARAPPEAVVDAWGGFTATLQRREPSEEEWQAALSAPEPPFSLLTVADLLPSHARPAYEAAGGDVN